MLTRGVSLSLTFWLLSTLPVEACFGTGILWNRQVEFFRVSIWMCYRDSTFAFLLFRCLPKVGLCFNIHDLQLNHNIFVTGTPVKGTSHTLCGLVARESVRSHACSRGRERWPCFREIFASSNEVCVVIILTTTNPSKTRQPFRWIAGTVESWLNMHIHSACGWLCTMRPKHLVRQTWFPNVHNCR